MKRLLFALLLLYGATVSHVYAQTAQFYLYIPDNSIISNVVQSGPTITPQFYDPHINEIISNYTITQWKKASPASLYEYLQKLYVVECDSIQLAYDLYNYDSTLFPHFEIIPKIVPTGYTPNDWSLYSTNYLEYIHARDAWAISKGDPNIVIGVSDSYFDMNNPDLQGKAAHLGYNVLPPGDQEHGSVVAGIAAGGTDNNVGYPAIGFNCKLDLEGFLAVSVLTDMSLNRNRKVLNASWEHVTPTDTLNLKQYFSEQSLFNEIYENGTTVCFGAGNGKPAVEITPRTFNYPASLDHNISVTGVGWEGDPPATFNVKHIHDINIGDSVTTHQHNSRVDICAPSVRIGGLAFDPNDTSLHFMWDQAWGTSFASPMVAGTIGLMLSVNPSLTPYQREWILKTTSHDIYGYSENAKYYNGVSRYTSRLGAGELDAGAAVSMSIPETFENYNAQTKTFKIKGIDLNTRCAPDAFAGVPKPRLKVILENGTPPYTFKWEPMPGNTAFLSVTSPPDSPIVSSCWGNCLLYYRLTVYDASDIQKVASKFIKIQLSTDSTWDLVMRDSYADMFTERNNMDSINAKEWNIWESPDVWNRDSLDGGLEHQDPEYYMNKPNYLYTRIKNIGCATSPNTPDDIQLNLYWTITSTGETWDVDWIGNSTLNNQPAGEYISGGGFGIPSIKPGDEHIMTTPWYPPQPQLYDTAAQIDACVLARITQPGSNDGMTIAEDSVTKENVWNNNNIVTRNLVVNNYNTGNKTSTTTVVGFGNSSGTPGTFTLNVLTAKHIEPYLEGNLAHYFTVTLHLGDLYDKWDAGGKLGNPTSYDDISKSITYDLETPLRLDNITLEGHEKHYIYVTIALKDGVNVPVEIDNERIYIRQVIPHEVEIDNGDGTSFYVQRDEVYGSVNFSINVAADETGDAKTNKVNEVIERAQFAIYPNPVQNILTVLYLGNEKISGMDITVVDIQGRVVMERKDAKFSQNIERLNTANLSPGAYFINMNNRTGEKSSMKFIKMK